MPRQAEADNLRLAGRDPLGREILLIPEASAAWAAMRDKAKSDGLELLLLSGFRSVGRQAEILRQKLKAGEALPAILAVSAYPGHSEHHTGRAVDIGARGFRDFTEDFEKSPEFGWLRSNAEDFGFHLSYPRSNPHGVSYEPWHWCLAAEGPRKA
jgi:D-alanyl-D-alanine carboxypeptidase